MTWARPRSTPSRGRWPGVFQRMAVDKHPVRFDATNAAGLVAAYDVIIDGTDNFAAKFLANDAAVLAGKPLVHAAAVGVGGPAHDRPGPRPPLLPVPVRRAARRRASVPRAPKPASWARFLEFWGRWPASKRPGSRAAKLPLSPADCSSMIRGPCRSGPSGSTPIRYARFAHRGLASARSRPPSTDPKAAHPKAAFPHDHCRCEHQDVRPVRSGPQVPRVRLAIRKGARCTSARCASARWKSTTTTPPSARC